MSRQDQFRGTVVVDGIGDIGVFDKVTGGGRGGTTNSYRLGSMGNQLQLGGHADNDDLVLERIYQTDRDHLIYPQLLAAASIASAHYHETPLDADGVPFTGARGKTITYNGVLMKVTRPDRDANSTSAAVIQLTIAVEGTPA